MKSNYSLKSVSFYLFSLCVLVLISSCTIYQNVPDDDGIYSSKKKEARVIVANSDEHKEYENNYFTKELERLDLINGTDILTDIEAYSSLNDSIPNEMDSITNYNSNRAWGYNDYDDVVINIDLNRGFGWGNNWNLYDPYFQYGFFNPWFGGNWAFGWGNRWNNPGFYWAGFRRFNNPFFNPFGPYHPFYHGLAGYRSARWRFLNGGIYGYNNYNYGRRNGYASTINRRTTNASRNRNTFVSNNSRKSRARNSSNNSRRRTTSTRNRNTSRRTISRNTRNSRSTINRSSNSRTNRSSTSRRTSTRTSTRSSSSRGSSGRSGSSSRGSSSRRGG